MLAILCYICSPKSSKDFCQSVSDVSECVDKVEGASTTARVCANISFEILFGGQTMNANIMKCENKVWLWWSFYFCSPKSNLPGVKLNNATILVFRWHNYLWSFFFQRIYISCLSQFVACVASVSHRSVSPPPLGICRTFVKSPYLMGGVFVFKFSS